MYISCIRCVKKLQSACAWVDQQARGLNLLAQVAGDTTRGEAVIQQMTSQQGSSASACKLLSAQPGQESLLAAAVLAPILLWEIMISPGKSGRAGNMLE